MQNSDVIFKIPSHSFVAMGVVLGLLALATIIRLSLKRKHPERDDTELKLRIQSWWWMIGIVFAALGAGMQTSIVLFAFISFLALKEFFSIVPMRLSDRRVAFWAYLAIPLQYYWVAMGWYGMFIIFIPVYVFSAI